MTKKTNGLTPEQETIRELSERLVEAQKPIRILDAIKWDDSIKKDFFDKKFKKLPKITHEYYISKNKLSFDTEKKVDEFYALELLIKKRLGTLSGVGLLMQRMCREYRATVRLLQHRGTSDFYKISESLYGSAEDVFYQDGPSMSDLATFLASTLPALHEKTLSDADKKIYTSTQAVKILGERLAVYFGDPHEKSRVRLSDKIIADAAAGAEVIKVKRDAMFSDRDLRLLEVHEGWVHLGTTLNGLNQPICTFLSKGPPSSTITQEGLAVIMEIFTFSAFPARLQRLTNRIIAIGMVEKGANFLDVFNFFRENGASDQVSYSNATRVFRGGLPEGTGPFTKDLVYSKGFILIYNYIRLAILSGHLEQIPLLFIGKTTLQDLPLLVDLTEQGLVKAPLYVPPQFRDLAALSSWMSYSLFLNKINIQKLAVDFRAILRD